MVNLKDGRVYKLTKDNLSRTPKDDYREHPTKKSLDAKYYKFTKIANDNKRRDAEKKAKQGMYHNHG